MGAAADTTKTIETRMTKSGRLLPALFAVLFAVFAIGCSADTLEEEKRSTHAATTSAAKDAATALEQAVQKKEATDQRLGRLIARVGPMMTAEQHRQFVKAFQALPDVAATSADYHARAIALDTELTRILSNDTELAKVMAGITERTPVGRGAVARLVYGPQDVFNDYAMLAETPYATGALKFSIRLLTKDARLARIHASNEDIVNKILLPALPGTFLENLLRSGSTREAKHAVAEILKLGGEQCSVAADWIEQYNDLTGSDVTADTVLVSGASVGEGLRTIAGIIAIWDLGANLARGDVDAAIQSFVDGGPTAITGVASAASLFRRVILGVEETPLADKVIAASGRIATGIGVIVSVFTLAEHLGKWNDGLDQKVRVASDVVAIAAGVLCLVSTGPVGPILAVAAMSLSFVADWLQGRAIEEQERADLTACLPKTGIPANVIATMMDANPDMVRILAQDVKLAPEQLQWLITVDDWAVSAKGPALPLRYIGLQVAQNIFSLDSAEVQAMLTAAIGNETRPEVVRYMVDAVLRGMEFDFAWNGDLSKAEALAWFDAQVNSDFVDGDVKPYWQKAYRGARGYLATK